MSVEEECYVVYIKLIHCQNFHRFIYWNDNPRLKVKGAHCQQRPCQQRGSADAWPSARSSSAWRKSFFSHRHRGDAAVLLGAPRGRGCPAGRQRDKSRSAGCPAPAVLLGRVRGGPDPIWDSTLIVSNKTLNDHPPARSAKPPARSTGGSDPSFCKRAQGKWRQGWPAPQHPTFLGCPTGSCSEQLPPRQRGQVTPRVVLQGGCSVGPS